MNKGFAFSFNAMMALGVAIIAIFLLSLLLNQINSEKNLLHAKNQSLAENDIDFYSNSTSSESLLPAETGYCSVFLKYPKTLNYNPAPPNLTEIKNCVVTNE